MSEQKQENLLNISLEVSESEREKSPDLSAGVSDLGETWEIIVKYSGDIAYLQQKYPMAEFIVLLGQYAIINTPREYIEEITAENQIEYAEKPKLLYFDLQTGLSVSCITQVQAGLDNPYGLFGNKTITAIIDTGIDMFRQEFKNEDGSSRIISIWDQTTDIELSGEEINRLVQENTMERRNSLVVNMPPGYDYSGHGTNVALIACGNNGVAKKSDIMVVKLGISAPNSFPRTTQLMRAVDYVLRKAEELSEPVAINISIGNNYGDHTGESLLERYLNDVSFYWKSVICVGSGNEGIAATHTFGYVTESSGREIELAVSTYETSLNIQIWKDYADDIEVEIITPSGENIGRIGRYNYVNRFETNQTVVLGYYGQPSPYTMRQEIYIDMIPVNNYIQYGIWKIRLVPIKIVVGRFDMWLPSERALNEGTGFVEPAEELTLTIPSTADKVITVGAYDARTLTFAPFSGTGYVTAGGAALSVKPEIAAPGVDVRISENRSVTGTSFAVPFVTGSAALLMEWGIVRMNDPYLYGEKVKAYLIRGARRLPGFSQYPNENVGYGALCVADSIP